MSIKPLSREFLLTQSKCCKNSCLNCPYGYKKNKMNITIYTIAFQEEFILPFFIKWYRDRFPNCKIVIYDNESTDNTVKIALNNNCEVKSYNTNNQLSDSMYLEIKNNCWKQSGTDWVLICDVDEFLDITSEDLNTNKTLFRSKGYNMCNVNNVSNILDIKHGVDSPQYDKTICFNSRYIKEINYAAGCHSCSPIGDVLYSYKTPKLLHMKFINEDYMVDRYKMFKNRMSEENIKKGWGVQYTNTEEIIRRDYKNHLNASKNIYE